MNKLFGSVLIFLLIAGSLILSCSVDPDLLNVKTVEELETALHEQVSNSHLTSISYCVVKGDQLLYSNAIGYADINNRIAATDSTRYLVASVSKTITATAIMQLVERDSIALDDDINNVLPYSIRNPDFPNEPITYRMLLSHRSSISDAHQNSLDLYCYGSDCAMSLEQYITAVFTSNGAYYSSDNFSSAQPGSAEDYSNLGYALLGYLVEKITNSSFDAYCNNNIFVPLGMMKSSWRLNGIPLTELAVPYSSDITNPNPHYTFPDYPNGGLRTTVKDLSLFLRAVILNGSLNGDTLLSTSSMAEMKQLQYGSNEQCLCFYYESVYRRTVLGHSGGEMGVTTEMYYDPAANVGVIVFNNNDDSDLRNIVSLLFSYGENQ